MFPASFDPNLVLTGYVGPAQLVTARRISERLRMPFLHFETLLERRAETGIEEFRLHFGETRLKALESEVMDEMSLARGSVLHISGHVLAQNGYLDRIRVESLVICLVASLDAVLSRLHLSMGARYHDPADRERAVGVVRREWSIRGRPGVIEIDTSYLAESEVVDVVTARWRELSGVVDLGRV